jgi:cellulose biosynthesis protein BcsQ
VSAPIVAFFSVRGGVGTTSLVYHLAWMFADLGVKVMAVDMDTVEPHYRVYRKRSA